MALLTGIGVWLMLPGVWNSEPVKPLKNKHISIDASYESPPSHRERIEEVSTFASVVSPFLQNYCLDCHTGEYADGDLDLAIFDSPESVIEHPDTWNRVINAIEIGLMPPDEYPALPSDEKTEAIRIWTEKALHDDSSFGQTTIRRLNRTEFENSIRDLFCLTTHVFDDPKRVLVNDHYFQPVSGKMPEYVLALAHFSFGHRKPAAFPGLSQLPYDPPVEHGFDNHCDSLSFSPMQLEAFFSVADGLINHPDFPGYSRIWNSLFVPDQGPTARQIETQAEQRLRVFLPRAFRRPLQKNELDRYLRHFGQQLSQGRSFQEAMKSTVTAVMVSPGFLFREDTSGFSGGQDDYSIASRISYFLWSSMPDAELFLAAREGRLRSESEVRKQVRRMMIDRRIKSLSTSFGMQWLKTSRAIAARPDRDLFGDFYNDLAESPLGVSMTIEQMLLFETILIENRSILEFIDADFAYLNRNLLEIYGMDPESSIGFLPNRDDHENFFRVTWPDRKRGGVLTSGATLVSTSTTTRTSPVFRGSWIMDVIFNRPPPSPPAGIPELDSTSHEHAQPVNFRERFENHRQNPTCAVCHDRIDPIGFALEEFDPAGQLREHYEDGSRLDSKGELFGQPFDGIVELKDLVIQDKQKFVTGFAEHLMEYSLGRSLHPGDRPTIRRIVNKAMSSDCRVQTIIEDVAVEVCMAKPAETTAVNPVPSMTQKETVQLRSVAR